MTRARLLDVSRLVSRAGLPATGVDRVEFAYLDGLIRDHRAKLFGLSRTALGFVLLDRAGLTALRDAIAARDFPNSDLIGRLNTRLSPPARQGQTLVRRRAVGRVRPRRLVRLLRRLPPEFDYINVGHSNLTDPVLDAVTAAGARQIVVLIHDTIPLDFPQMQRHGTVPRFRNMLATAERYATTLVCSTNAVATDLQRHMDRTQAQVIVAPLGVTPLEPAPDSLPPGAIPLRPYLVVLGTIEPRKNHALLLDIWDDWGPGAPELLILGRRGWRNDAVFARLDAGIPHVEERAGLSDGAIAALLERAHGLLFPSLAEGFGLPPIEAAGMGVPVICADLAACREVMGDWPVYADPRDRYEWDRQIKALLQGPGPLRRAPLYVPDWTSHLKTVLGALG